MDDSIREVISGVAKDILNKNRPIILLTGNLGAGKTTLTKFILAELNINEEVTSPTFSLINVYPYGAKQVYHLDLYRLDSLEEALDIGIEEILHSGNYTIIEWPQIIEDILPLKSCTLINILSDNNGDRVYDIKTFD